MGEWRRWSKNAARIYEKHQILLRAIDSKTQIGTEKKRTRNDKTNCKWTRKRITKITMKKEMKCKNEKKSVTENKTLFKKRVNKPTIYLSIQVVQKQVGLPT
jgi:hypothetical protein